MQNSTLTAAALATLATGALTAAENAEVAALISKIKDKDDRVRGPAWQGAAKTGAPAVKALLEVMSDPDFETARCAKRALWKIVRYAGRPAANAERKAVMAELVPWLKSGGVPVQREVLWMLSEIGDDTAVAAMAVLLSNAELREDARQSLTRMPGKKATDALKAALKTAPEDFKYHLAQSLRVRGEKINEYPSKKLVPTKQTTVTPTKAG